MKCEYGIVENVPCLSIISLIGTLVLLSFLPNMICTAYPQTTSPITSSGLTTTVTSNGNIHDITGGTRPGNGPNLFHSFGDFNVPTNNIANFLNAGSVDLNGNVLASNLPTSNILGRVTGGDPSAIFGMIQTNGPNGFGTANLFLMNPAGFLFGPNATVNVGGMVAFTTTDYLRLSNGVLFNNTPNVAQDALLSAEPVAAFGFLGSNAAAIAIQDSALRVAQGQTLSFVSGNQAFTDMEPDTDNMGSVPDGFTMVEGTLSAPGGQVNIASVASPGEILVGTFAQAPNINDQSFTTMGNITLSQGATVDVSADAAGSIKIRGGQFMIADATLSADTANKNGAPVAIDINLTGELIISDTLAIPAVSATTSGTSNAGMVNIVSANMEATSTDPGFASFALIASYSSGDGSAGNVKITTGNLNVTGPAGTWTRRQHDDQRSDHRLERHDNQHRHSAR
jgi:filamentous hemagglutinin family protein